MLWLVASEVVDGVISMPPRNLAFKLRVTEAELSTWVKPLIEKGFFESEGAYASEVLAPCVQGAVPEYRVQRQSTEKVKTLDQPKPLIESRFGVFWESYPRKVGKPAARKAWNAIVGIENHSGEVLAGLSRWIPTWTDPQFIPHPATFLNQRRWEDEPTKTGVKNERRVESYQERLERENAEVTRRVAREFTERMGANPRQKTQ
jgi:hypothetical protein